MPKAPTQTPSQHPYPYLELPDGLPKLLALRGIRDRHIQRRLHETHGTRGQHQALVVQAGHEHSHALVDAPQHILLRHLGTGKEREGDDNIGGGVEKL
jgi:hypothetical protein